MKVIITLQMNCTVTSFQKTGGARHPLGPMDATPMTVMYSFNHCKNSVLDLTKTLVNFLKYICLIPAKYQIELFSHEISYN